MNRFSALIFLATGLPALAHEGHDHQHGAASATIHQQTSAVILNEANWDRFVPAGKEVDAIYGDAVLANSHITAVIANAVPTRNANMTVRNVGGCLIDLTANDFSSDQLSCFYPMARLYNFSGLKIEQATTEIVENGIARKSAWAEVSTRGLDVKNKIAVTQKYRLEDNNYYLTIVTVFENQGEKAAKIKLAEDLRADGKENMVNRGNGTFPLYWFADEAWGQAYGVAAGEGWKMKTVGGSRTHQLLYLPPGNETGEIEIGPGQSFTLSRKIYPAKNLVEMQANWQKDLGKSLKPVEIQVSNAAGRFVANTLLKISGVNSISGTARTDANGNLKLSLPAGKYSVTANVMGTKFLENAPFEFQVSADIAIAQQVAISLKEWNPGTVQAKITDADGKPIACKVEFIPENSAVKPYFGPDSAEFGVLNLRYAPHGEFSQELASGAYKVIVSHGAEYDAIFTDVKIEPGKTAFLKGQLKRSVQTPGWVSTDYHSHSSPSGDNTSSQLGRVLNLVCEHIEFAPCTEHNRIETYDPEIAELKVGHAISTISGMELTGSPLPLNHQNVFPLIYKPRTQDGGGPITDADPTVQIERLFNWDNRSEKLIQQNHPDIGWLFYDKNGDGRPDGGHAGSPRFIDVMEVHPIDTILSLTPTATENGTGIANTIFAWLQLLNQGYRIPGVVNTDAHYNYHGSGGLRNWVQSSTDDPAKINAMEMVRASEQGRVIMSNGPYLEFTVVEQGGKKAVVAGQDLAAPSGKVVVKVRVQCPNWTDVNRVMLLVNGRPHEVHNYRRTSDPKMFSDGTVKFSADLEVSLKGDAHIIAVAAGEGLKLGPVMGPDWGKQAPAAVSNPVYVDVDGNGFKPNKDTLGYPLPVKFNPPK